MAHTEQIRFCLSVKERYPEYFKGVKVLDCGSLDINGTNRYLFEDSLYLGVDLVLGNNVDMVCAVDELPFREEWFDVMICTEVLEHDRWWKDTLAAMCRMCNGMIIITAAGQHRAEHGTIGHRPTDSPATNYYYKGVTREMLEKIYLYGEFKESEIIDNGQDIYFWGRIA